ncbi:hypothetical protein FACS1894120_4990 [Clostridia bacterium]|nr:hypothetical protein FACS1894120_4990 [Clostridia bacterium]
MMNTVKLVILCGFAAALLSACTSVAAVPTQSQTLAETSPKIEIGYKEDGTPVEVPYGAAAGVIRDADGNVLFDGVEFPESESNITPRDPDDYEHTDILEIVKSAGLPYAFPLSTGGEWGIASRPYAKIDVPETGADVLAIFDGKVTLVDAFMSGTMVIAVESENGYAVEYEYLSGVSVKEGDTVRSGQKLGEVKDTEDEFGLAIFNGTESLLLANQRFMLYLNEYKSTAREVP